MQMNKCILKTNKISILLPSSATNAFSQLLRIFFSFLSPFFTVKMKYFIALLSLWICIQSLQINNFNNKTNLIFIKTQNISIPDSYKTIEITLNMKNFLYETTILTYNINNITELCKQTMLNLHCNHFNNYVERNMNKLIYEKERIFRHLKIKRDLIDIFTFLKYLFPCICNLDQNTIDQLQQTDIENRNFTSEHIKIDNNTLLMHKNFLNNIAKDIFNTNTNIRQIRTQSGRLEKEFRISTLTMITTSLIDEHIKKINQISRILIYNNINDIFDVMSIDETKSILKELNKTLKTDERFLAENEIDIINTGILHSQTTNETIVLNIELPIEINNSQYQSFKIISIPFRGDDGSLHRIKTLNSYILYNNDKTFITNQFKLNTCKIITKNNNLICTIEEISDGSNECETAIFHGQQPKNCIIEKFQAIAYITRVQINTFYCVINKKVNFSMICDNKSPEEYELTQNSWITINENCFVNITGHIYYVPKINIKREFQILKTNNTDLIIDAKQIFVEFHNMDSNSFIIQEPLTNITLINNEIDKQSKQLDGLFNQTDVKITKIVAQEISTMTIVCYIIIIVIGLICIRCLYKCICGK